MKKIGNWIVFVVVSILSLSVVAESIKVYSFVDKKSVGKGDLINFSVAVESEDTVSVSEPRLMSMKGFELIGSHVLQSSSSTFVNGQFSVKLKKEFRFRVVPVEEGKLSLPVTEVVVNGKSYKTDPIQIDVSKTRTLGQGGNQDSRGRGGFRKFQRPGIEDEEDLFNQLLDRAFKPSYKSPPPSGAEAFFIGVEVDKTEVFVGEQVTVSWYLYTRAGIRDFDTLKYPTLKGFWKEDIEVATSLRFTTEVVNGIVYNKAPLATYALFPIKPGTSVIDAYKARCTMVIGGFGFGKPIKKTKSSRTVKINVKDLPKDNQPNDFAGAVGKFKVSGRLELSSVNNEVPANQPFNFKIRVSGKGNAKLVDLPELKLPSSIEIYDTKIESKLNKDGTSFKAFDVLLIPREVGTFTIPSVSLSFFDPENGSYYRDETGELSLNVLPGKEQNMMGSVPLAKNSVDNEPKDPMPPPILSFEAGPSLNLIQQIIVALTGFFVVIVILIWRVFSEFGIGKQKKDLNELLSKRMEGVRKRAKNGDWRGVGVELTNTIYFLLGNLSGVGGANLELEKMLRKLPPSVRRELGADLTKTMSKLEILSFAPEQVVGGLKDEKELASVIKESEKILKRSVQLVSGIEVS